LFKLGVLKSIKSTVPVVIVGNISVGGTGKTPFVVYLVEFLKSAGLKPGIVSRGYGSERDAPYPRLVTSESSVSDAGDEPKLLALKTACPVVIAPKRAEAVAMLERETQVDVIISDDGLQHYEMARDAEIVLVDGDRQHGNGWLLPVGPLREPISRLKSVDLVIENTGFKEQGEYRLAAGAIYNLAKPEQTVELSEIKAVHLISGIGNPNRFVDTVRGLNLEIQSETWFPDHHPFSESDFQQFQRIPSDEIILMTEKDAVKCSEFAQNNWFVLPIAAVISDALEKRIMQLIDKKLK
jgi:tetraacyldisaccharide 4'-kinase